MTTLTATPKIANQLVGDEREQIMEIMESNVAFYRRCNALAKADDLSIQLANMREGWARFPNVSCSQCGRDFGPGDGGYSHCEHHCDHKWEWVVDWYGDPNVINGTQDCSSWRCRKCDAVDEERDRPSKGRDQEYERE